MIRLNARAWATTGNVPGCEKTWEALAFADGRLAGVPSPHSNQKAASLADGCSTAVKITVCPLVGRAGFGLTERVGVRLAAAALEICIPSHGDDTISRVAHNRKSADKRKVRYCMTDLYLS